MTCGRFILAGAIGLLPAAGALRAEVKIAGVFGEHMVLQRGVQVPVWGTARPAEAIRIQFAGQSVWATAGPDGRWSARFERLTANAVPSDMTITGGNTITIQDILVGDVWLGAGQSNMEYSLSKDRDAAQETPLANHPDIRLCRVSNHPAREPLADRGVNWTACTPETVRGFSAVCYYFARDVERATQVPVGMIAAAVSGTPGQLWVSLPALQSDPDFDVYINTYNSLLAGPPASAPASAATAAAFTAPASRPAVPRDPNAAPSGLPASLYNGMIHPLAPFPLKGFLWYQGESNTSDALIYRKLLPALIKNWRADWGQGDLPFLIVQLPGNNRRVEAPAASKWALVREAQGMALAAPHTGMAVTLDLSLERNILHPPNKREVGRRLSLAARRLAYGEKIADAGPMFKAWAVEKDKIRITFTSTGAGLVSGAPNPTDPNEPTGVNLPLAGFSIAGSDHRFVVAEAVIEGDSVLVWSAQVPTPVAVRYGWADNPLVTLYNKEGLPAGPFRTDDWSN
jgi:sialate O-acetylesterase